MPTATVHFCFRGHALTPDRGRYICGSCQQAGFGTYQESVRTAEVELLPAAHCACGWTGVPLADGYCPWCRKPVER